MTKRTKWLYIMGLLTVIVLVALMIYSVVLGVTYKPVTGEECEHDFGEWEVAFPPTCGEGGTEEHRCKICGKSEARRLPQTYNHKFGEWEEVYPPTCGDYGMERRTCIVCEQEVTRSIPPTEKHDFDANGICRKCGKNINDLFGNGKDPGEDPGKDPGEDPGKDPGEDPGKDPGKDPGEDPGKDPNEKGSDVDIAVDGPIAYYPSEPKTALRIYSEKSGIIYLRYMSCGDYTGNRWLQAEDYGNLLLGDYSFAYLPGFLLALSGMQTYSISIETYGTQYVLPYYMALGYYDYTIQGNEVCYEGDTKGVYSLAYYGYDYLKNGMPSIALPAGYVQLELDYRNFVYNNYLNVPESTADYLKGIIAEQGFDLSDPDVIAKIARYIQQSATYNLNYNHDLDFEDDIAVAFLSKYREGICQHYASAATLLFRTLGIPARYVGGFVGNSLANEWVEISTANAHAWVEVYLDGFGWVQVEVTGAGADGVFGNGEEGHVFGDWEELIPPTCGAEGVEHRVCEECGEEETRKIPPTGEHSFGEWEEVTPPTCGDYGWEHRVCEVCGEEETREIPPTGEHRFGEWEEVTPPTCSDEGLEHRICEVCGEEETREIPPTGEHSFGEWKEVTPPTCGDYGWEKHVCEVCGEEETRKIPPTGEHTFGEWEEVTPPTCGDYGLEHRVCEVCGQEQTRWNSPTGEHRFGEWEEVTPPTCGDYGREHCVCDVCGEEESRAIMPTGEHRFGEWEEVIPPTCGDEGLEKHVCDVCGHEEERDIPPTQDHNWGADDICQTCGARKSNSGNGNGNGSGFGNGGVDLDSSGMIGVGNPIEGSQPSTVLRLLSEIDGTIYLRFMNFGDYVGGRWLQAEEYGGHLSAEYGFAYLPGVVLGLSGMSAYELSIETFGSQYLLPYYMAMGDYNYTIQGNEVSYEGNTDAIYRLAYYSYNYLLNGKPSVTLPAEYVWAELAYRSFVYNNYLRVPDSTKAYLKQIIAQQGFDLSDSNVIAKVAQYIQQAAKYNAYYDRALDKEDDIVVSFLSKYKEGICQHYASAATLLFRALGLPARYVIGFAGTSQANEWVNISQANAHAWVEVYLDGFGWVQVEVTGAGAGGGGQNPGQNPGGGDFEIGDTTVTLPEGGTIEPNGDGTVTVPEDSTVTPPNGPTMTLPDGGIVDEDGNVTLPGGGDIEIGDTTVTVPEGGTIEPNGDGTVTVPEGSTVTPPNGPTMTLPDGGIVDEDGNVTLPGGGDIVIGDTTVTVPEGGTVKPNGDGTVTVPGGSTVTPPNGPTMTLPDGGIVDKDGNVTLPGGGDIQIGDTTVTVPEGGTVKPNGDGTVTVPGGSTVTPPNGPALTLPDGGIVDKDGNVTLPDGDNPGQGQEQIALTIRSKSFRKEYDGKPFQDEGLESVVGLLKGHYIASYYQSASEFKNVGVAENVIKNVRIFDSAHNDVSKMYKIQCEYGTLEITYRQITLQAGSAEKAYDKTPLTCEKCEIVEGMLAKGDWIDFDKIQYTGSQTNRGRCDNSINIASIKIYDAEGNDVTQNYAIMVINGKLKVV